MHFLVVGAGGHAEEVAWSLREQERARGHSCRISFFDDRVGPGSVPSRLGAVEGTLDDLGRHARGDGVRAVLGLGLPRTKAAVTVAPATLR